MFMHNTNEHIFINFSSFDSAIRQRALFVNKWVVLEQVLCVVTHGNPTSTLIDESYLRNELFVVTSSLLQKKAG